MTTGPLVKLPIINTDTLYENVGTKLSMVMALVSAGYISIVVCNRLEIITTILSTDEVFVDGIVHVMVADTSPMEVATKSLTSTMVPATGNSQYKYLISNNATQ